MSKKVETLARMVDSKVGKLSEKGKQVQFDANKMSFSKLYQEATKEDKVFLYFGWLAACLTGLGLPSFIFLIGDVIDSFAPTNSKEDTLKKIKEITIIFALIGIAVWFFGFVFYGFLLIFSEKVARRTRVAYLKAILKQDCTWFDTNNYQELPSRMNQEIIAIQKAVGEKMGVIIFALSMSVSGITFGMSKGWSLALVIMGMFPLISIGVHFSIKLQRQGFSKSLKAYGQSAGYAEQALNAIKVVTSYGQQAKESRNYSSFLELSAEANIKRTVFQALSVAYFMFSVLFAYSYAFFFGCIWVNKEFRNDAYNRNYSAGDVMVCFFGIFMGLISIGTASPNIQAVAEGKSAANSAFQVIDRTPEIGLDNEENDEKKKILDLKGKIEFKNVNFYYPSRSDQLVLNNFSCLIHPGKTTAIVGPSGSGKSTVIQLIERFYDPNQGQVLIDDTDLKLINLRSFRQQVGLVSQEPTLFNTSIKENIKLGNPDASDSEIREALKKAMALEFVENHQEGIELGVGNMGGQISGGQKQRLAIARAFIKKPKILLLDEATSALDKQNEQKVQEAIDSIGKELGFVTTVVIAHRLSTIKNADEIIVMEKGKVVEKGNHQSLLKDFPNGTYAKLVRQQENVEQQPTQTEIILKESPKIQVEKQLNQRVSINNMPKKKLSEDLEKPETLKNPMEDKMTELADSRDKSQQQLGSQKPMGFFQFLRRLSPYSKPTINVIVGTIMGAVQGSILPIFGLCLTKALFSMQIPIKSKMWDDTIKWILIMFIISLASFFCILFYRSSFSIVASNITKSIRSELYLSYLRKNISFFDLRENSPGDLTNTLASDVQILNGISTEGLAVMIEANSSIITGLIIGFYFCWQISLVALGCFPLMVFGGLVQAKFRHGFQNVEKGQGKSANLIVSDSIINFKTVQSFANENVLIDQFDKQYEFQYKEGITTSILIGFLYGFSQFSQNTIFALLYYAGAEFQLIYSNINGMDLFIAIFAIFYGAAASGQANQFGPDIGKSVQAGERVFRALDAPSLIDPLEIPKEKIRIDKQKFRGTIEFKNVWFRYPTRKNEWVFKGLNLKINENESIAIVGESGCGKSTFTNLLLRFYDIDSGEILIDGVNIKDYNVQDLRMQMGHVMQEPTLFNYSIKDNILYGNSQATNSMILKCSEIANVMEFINSDEIKNVFDDNAENLVTSFKENKAQLINLIGQERYERQLLALEELKKKEMEEGVFSPVQDILDDREQFLKDVELPEGFNTNCGMKGNKLSGGQKQRIAIARAIVRQPSILILDEATSALDENSQTKVQKALENVMQGRTSIVIAHRLTTVEKCSRLAVISDGQIVEEGTFNQLRNQKGFFQNLAQGMDVKK